MNFADFIRGMHGMPEGMHGGMGSRLPPPPSEAEVAELYGRLGVSKGATGNQLKKAYRKSALRNHPDRGGDPQTFQKIQEAFDILGDDGKRAVFLRTGYKGLEMGLDAEDVDPEARRRREAKPEDLRLAMKCQLSDVLRPISREITVQRAVVENGRQRQEQVTLHVNIPASAPDGFPIRLMESGHIVDGIAGDVLIRLRVRDHPDYERNGPDLLMQKRVSLRQALGGFVLNVQLVEGGRLDVAVPPGRALGDPLLVPGYGMPLTRAGVEAGRGSIIVILQVAMPSGTAGVKLSAAFAEMAWKELEALSAGRGEGAEEPMARYSAEKVEKSRRAAEKAEELRRKVEAGEIEDAGRRRARLTNMVEVGYDTLDKEAMQERKKEWARNCGADRLEEEGQEGG